jgi:DHA1 family bicyclomycin/chloramphenicol resistance-like MFS transporter
VPLALDAYLPSFTQIADHLGVSPHEVGLTLSVYVFLLAFGQLIGGPLSDRYGRCPVMFAGLAVFIAGSLLVTTADSLSAMLGWRALQAFGGGWVAVSVPAIVRDHTSGNDTARLFSLIALIMFIAPALAPALGTLLLSVMGWRGIFHFLAVYAILVSVLLRLFLFPVLPATPPSQREPLRALVGNYRHVLGHRTAILLVLMQALVFSVMLIYLTHASFLYQDWLGLGNGSFSLMFALNVSALAGVALLNRRLLRHFEPEQIFGVAVRLQTLAVILLCFILVLPAPRWLLIPAMMLVLGCMGAIGPNVQASIMQYFRELGGTAAAVLGTTQFALGGVLSALSALVVQGHAGRVGISMFITSLLAASLVRPVRRSRATLISN